MATEREAVVADLARLVAFDSVSSRPMRELAGYVADRCEALGFRTEILEDVKDPGKASVIASIGPETGDREGLVLSGHLDVVPTEGQPWTSDPFRVVERGGNLYGRGTADMKGFLAATLQALAGIDRRSFTRELSLVWTHDEEVGCLGSAQIAAKLLERRRVLPRACLIGEPTGFRIFRMHPGHVGVEIVLHGQAAHSSRPDLGINAIDAAARVIAAIGDVARELEAERGGPPEMDRPWVAVNVGNIQGGSAINIVPDRCRILLGYRQLPGMAEDAPFQRIRDRIAALDLPGGWDARILRVTPSLLTHGGTLLESDLVPHACTPDCGSATFATDGGNLAKLGLEPLVFGPGSIEVAHQADEHVPVADLVRAVDVIGSLVRKRCC